VSLDIYEVIESILDSNDGEVRGRTAIQKLVYLSKAVVPELRVPPYRPHYYGPYCSDLSLALEKMVAYSFIEEVKVPGHMYEGYTYRLTIDGLDLVKSIKVNQKKQYDEIKRLVKTCKQFCELRINPLSYAAKIFFMLESLPKNERKMSYQEAVNKAERFGWNIIHEDVEHGVQLLETLNLVKVER